MDQHRSHLASVHLHTLTQNLCARGFEVFSVKDKAEARFLVASMIEKGQSVSVGGSMTLFECGIIDDLMQRKDIRYLDRYHCEDVQDIFHQALDCDVYLTSTNALTMQGELVNMDGTGNRVAAMTYGPKRVLVIAGRNKVTSSLSAAIERIEQIAAPANCLRLNKDTPCAKTGHCAHCLSPMSICGTLSVIRKSIPKRISVILVDEDLGY